MSTFGKIHPLLEELIPIWKWQGKKKSSKCLKSWLLILAICHFESSLPTMDDSSQKSKFYSLFLEHWTLPKIRLIYSLVGHEVKSLASSFSISINLSKISKFKFQTHTVYLEKVWVWVCVCTQKFVWKIWEAYRALSKSAATAMKWKKN